MLNFLQRSFLIFTLATSSAFAAYVPYKQAEFDQLLKHDKPVVLHVFASWCPVCRAQKEVLEKLMPMPEFKNLPVLQADFDTENALLRKYNVHNQSTFIVFKNGKEVIRSTGQTDEDAIADLLRKAL
ncbi:MAG: thioredoxin family protein [Gallionellaceae bacterium]|jgi:thioredoxin 1